MFGASLILGAIAHHNRTIAIIFGYPIALFLWYGYSYLHVGILAELILPVNLIYLTSAISWPNKFVAGLKVTFHKVFNKPFIEFVSSSAANAIDIFSLYLFTTHKMCVTGNAIIAVPTC